MVQLVDIKRRLRGAALAMLCVVLIAAQGAIAQSRFRGMTLAPTVSPAEIQELAAMGARFARFNLHWLNDGADTGSEAEYAAWLETALSNLDALLPVFAANNVKVAVALHTPPGGFVTHSAPALHRIFAESWAQTALLTSWRAIASRYANNQLAQSVIYAYIPVSEPAQRSVAPGLKKWKDLAPDVVAAIREFDAAKPLIILPLYGNVRFLGSMPVINDSAVIYGSHVYTKLNFVQQGLYNYPINKQYPAPGFNRGFLQRTLITPIRRFQRKRNLTKFFVGEFSVVRWAPNGSAKRYLNDLVNLFERRLVGCDWNYHAYREDNAWSVEHSSTNKDDTTLQATTDRKELMIEFFARP